MERHLLFYTNICLPSDAQTGSVHCLGVPFIPVAQVSALLVLSASIRSAGNYWFRRCCSYGKHRVIASAEFHLGKVPTLVANCGMTSGRASSPNYEDVTGLYWTG